MEKCRVCGGADFYKEAGYYFCQTCQTQNEDIREEVLDIRIDNTTRIRKTRIRKLRPDRSGEELGWTSWELYNFVLIGLTNELIELGIPSEIKLTILQLWATYLGKIEVAFISRRKKCLPKLARRYKMRDAEIIYGKVQSQKKQRKRKRAASSINTSGISSGHSDGSTIRELNKNKKLMVNADYERYLQSQGSSDGDGLSLFSQSVYSAQSSSVQSSDNEGRVQFSSHAKEEARRIKQQSKKIPRSQRRKYREKHIGSQYKRGPHIVTPMRLWAIIYLALRIHHQPIQLGDMLRYAREGHLSYYKLDHLLPPEVSLTSKERSFLTQKVELTHKGMRRLVASMAKFLGVWNINCPDFLSLVHRYCRELGLPRGIQLYAERVIALSPPRMIFNSTKSHVPNYEGRAMGFIMVVLKVLFAMDGITEYQISRIAEKINRLLGQGECSCYEINVPCIIVHGGAGNFSESIVMEKMIGCKKAAINGYKTLMNGKTSVDAVESALWWLECDEFFNCGYGSVLNEIGKVQMDASIMDGFTFKCGSVAAVSDIEHPITLAKYVLNNYPNSIFVGDGAQKLAKHANINLLSDGNMVAPRARLAFSRKEMGSLELNVDDPSLLDIDALSESFDTVGCVAYDGYSIAAGTTTGGLNKKLLGRVGDTPFLGCATYATKEVGCSLTGHGESIMKLGLAREIVQDIKCNVPGQEALQKYFSHMLENYDQVGGGIVLQPNGYWATYFTTNKMPYAVIVNDLITYGARLNEERKETVAIDRGLLKEKLFSFHEWQRYMECKKTILVHAHFPTRMKHIPESDGIDDLYIKFFEFITSKSNGQESNVKNSKYYIPEELVNAMARHITSLNLDDAPSKTLDIFPPSLTPLHSYFQCLLEHPLYDIPIIARNDFFQTKVGYLTNLDSLVELGKRCGIELEVVDSNLHFLEKTVPPFEQPRMPSVEELKQTVVVQENTNKSCAAETGSLNDYLHAKVPCIVKFDVAKKQHYESIQSSSEDSETIGIVSGFGFTETLANGKLAIPASSDSESEEEEEEDSDFTSNSSKGTIKLGNKFCDKYNLCLSLAERDSIYKTDAVKSIRFKMPLVQLERNAKGQFVKGITTERRKGRNDPLATIENVNFSTGTRSSVISKAHSNSKAAASSGECDINISDVELDESCVRNNSLDLNDYCNLSDISFLDEFNEPEETKGNTARNEVRKFFRPFKDYWMYHCIFSRVKQKNFSVFEKELPRSFRWLLNECALIVEMSTRDLYEEVCLIETYHAQVLPSKNSRTASHGDTDSMPKNQLNFLLNKW